MITDESVNHTKAIVNRMVPYFEGIDGTNLGIEYDPGVREIEMAQGHKKSDGQRAGKLCVGPKFLLWSTESQYAAVAHELGHFEQFLKLTEKQYNKLLEMKTQQNKVAFIPKTVPLEKIPFEIIDYAHWYTDNEVYADNKAVELGLTVPLLRLLEEPNGNQAWLFDYALKKRIENLEGKIREGILR